MTMIERLIYITIIAVVLAALLGCGTVQQRPATSDKIYIYKYNPIERKYDLADPESRLRYNVLEREWQYAR